MFTLSVVLSQGLGGLRPPKRSPLAKQCEGSLRRRVRLGEHCDASLLQDLRAGEPCRLGREVRVLDPAARSTEVLDAHGQVGDDSLEAVLNSAEGGTSLGDGLDVCVQLLEDPSCSRIPPLPVTAALARSTVPVAVRPLA
jgi:hypothetical protein